MKKLTGLSLRFANTAGFRPLADRPETIRSVTDLVDFFTQEKVAGSAMRRKLLALDPDESARVMRRALAFRDALQTLFSRLSRKRPVPPADLQIVSDEIRRGVTSRELVASPSRVAWKWATRDAETILFGEIALDAETMLKPQVLSRLRECSGRDCSRFFVDESKNGSRRWCSMSECGNRAKARRHYRRTRTDP